MRFGPDDEDAYFARRDELGEQFAQWLTAQRVTGEPSDADLLMDWKWGYADGALDRWTVADVHAFLFEWCPRKLSAEPSDCTEIPVSVAAFVEFLAHTGMLGRGSDPPSAIRRHCERKTAAFIREMGDPANFGMAKSLLGSVGGLDLGTDRSPEGIAALLNQLAGLPGANPLRQLPAAVGELPPIGPVRLPAEADRLAAASAAPVLRQLRALAEFCAPPGRALTTKGNLRLADARHLVDALDTGDDPTMGGGRTLQSAEDLPHLSRLVDVAVRAGALCRQRGRLLEVARFTGLDDAAAHEKVVLAAVDSGLRGPHNPFLAPALAQLNTFVDECALALLADLLEHSDAGVEVDTLAEIMVKLVAVTFPGLAGLPDIPISRWAREHLERLADLGVLTVSDVEVTACGDCGLPHHRGGHATLTAAGVAVAVELVRQAGIEVLVRPEPATADAAAIIDLIVDLDEQEWTRDVADWFAAQPDPSAATAALAAEITAGHRDPLIVVAGIGMLDDLAHDHVVDALRPHLGGPHDGLVLQWLIGKEAVDPATVDPVRIIAGLVDVLVAALDAAGPSEVAACFSSQIHDRHLEFLDTIWRLDHPRLPDLLDALGAHHPTKSVAKAARKALVRHRSRLATASR